MKELPPIWIGHHYRTGGALGTRTLLIGESTYPAPGDNTFLYNRRIPEEHMSGACRDQFRTRLVRALLNTSGETLDDIKRACESVAFFNYITSPLTGPGAAPTEQAWASEHQPLKDRLAELNPQAVLVLSCRLWDRIATSDAVSASPGPVLDGGLRPQTYWWRTPGGRALAYGIQHPSYLSWRSEHPRLKRVLSLAQSG